MNNEEIRQEYERVAGKPLERTPIEPMQPIPTRQMLFALLPWLVLFLLAGLIVVRL